MDYVRVTPRDIFNEAGLLKCYGRLAILLGELGNHNAVLSEGNGSPFHIVQDESSGEITIANLPFTINGQKYGLTRPLNSKESWPLYATDMDDEATEVFTHEGNFTRDFLVLIGKIKNG